MELSKYDMNDEFNFETATLPVHGIQEVKKDMVVSFLKTRRLSYGDDIATISRLTGFSEEDIEAFESGVLDNFTLGLFYLMHYIIDCDNEIRGMFDSYDYFSIDKETYSRGLENTYAAYTTVTASYILQQYILSKKS